MIQHHVFTLYWAPEGRPIAYVSAVSDRAACGQAPMPYRRYIGEVYAVAGRAQTSQNIPDLTKAPR